MNQANNPGDGSKTPPLSAADRVDKATAIAMMAQRPSSEALAKPSHRSCFTTPTYLPCDPATTRVHHLRCP